ncbi:hypothetical protein L596_003963 [Steinernema carpocapsae]|uniref:Uncharacterized protein n=1 Tax=Steinernema carpocapsae TaxID=34508 RepID=A0A4V6I878_STECR|nr:hypothetical protein L596_003963 [Steinernema carpocapsae]
MGFEREKAFEKWRQASPPRGCSGANFDTPVQIRLREQYEEELESLDKFQRRFREEELGIRQIRPPSTISYGGYTFLRVPITHDYVEPHFLRHRYPGFVEELEEIEGSFDPSVNRPPIPPEARPSNVIYPKPYVGPRFNKESANPAETPAAVIDHQLENDQGAPPVVQSREAVNLGPLPPVQNRESQNIRVASTLPAAPPPRGGSGANFDTPVQIRLREQYKEELESLDKFQRRFREEELGIRQIRPPSTISYGGYTFLRVPITHDYVEPHFLRHRYPGFVEELEEIEGSFDPSVNRPPIPPEARPSNVIYPKPYVGPRFKKESANPAETPAAVIDHQLENDQGAPPVVQSRETVNLGPLPPVQNRESQNIRVASTLPAAPPPRGCSGANFNTPVQIRLREQYKEELESLDKFQRRFREEELGIRQIRPPSTISYGGYTFLRVPIITHDYVEPHFLRHRYPGFVEELEEIEGSFDPSVNRPPIPPEARKPNVIYPKPYVGPRFKKDHRPPVGEPSRSSPRCAEQRNGELGPIAPCSESGIAEHPSGLDASLLRLLAVVRERTSTRPFIFGSASSTRRSWSLLTSSSVASERKSSEFVRFALLPPSRASHRYPGFVEELEEIEGSFDPSVNRPPVPPEARPSNVIYPKPYVGPRDWTRR